MLKAIGFNNLDEFISAVVPEDILLKSKLSIGSEKKEQEALIELKRLASKNDSFNSYIGQGYYNTITPGVILRNVLKIQDGTPLTLLISLKFHREDLRL